MKREPWHYDAIKGKPPELVTLSLHTMARRHRENETRKWQERQGEGVKPVRQLKR